MKMLLPACAILLLLAGCGEPTPKPTFGLGDQAVSIAHAVRACRAISAQPVRADSVGIDTLATCSINGRQVDFVVWSDLEAQKAQGPIATATSEGYVAHGHGWDAVTHDDGLVSGQKILMTAIVGYAGGTVVHVP